MKTINEEREQTIGFAVDTLTDIICDPTTSAIEREYCAEVRSRLNVIRISLTAE